MQEFLNRLMDAAKAAGIEAAEAYVVERESFSAMSNECEITEYKSNLTRGLGLSLIQISEPTRRRGISDSGLCL